MSFVTTRQIGLLDLYAWYTRAEILGGLPKDWERALAVVSKYFGWSRADTWGCTLSELRWWYARIEEMEDHDE